MTRMKPSTFVAGVFLIGARPSVSQKTSQQCNFCLIIRVFWKEKEKLLVIKAEEDSAAFRRLESLTEHLQWSPQGKKESSPHCSSTVSPSQQLFSGQMKPLLLLGIFCATCAAAPRDLSGKMFTFPKQSTSSYVKLFPSQTRFSSVTLCQRYLTDLRRDHVLFSLATPSFSNALMLMWVEGKKSITTFVKNTESQFDNQDRKLNMWHSVCFTWESSTGIAQLWLDSKPSVRRFLLSGWNIDERSMIIILGQEQDSHGGSFSASQSFVGMVADVHMWSYVLSPGQIRAYTDGREFTPGNVINWKALEYRIFDRVLIENKALKQDDVTSCSIAGI
ncbi:LOW QUALITY PROTEIN: C-reactive protein-like [Synchiropus picturatus]